MGPSQIPPDRDTLLQVSRRVDWRFLLPDPDLGRVACLGKHDPELVDALGLLSESLTLLDAGDPETTEERAPHDLVVLCDPTLETLQAAAGLLRPGGWLYVEVHGPLTPGGRKLRRPRFARDYLAVLEQLGFEEREAYWHWPDFASCLEIVSLADPIAIRHALGRRQSGAGARLKARLGRLLLGSGLLGYLVPQASVVGRWPGADREGTR